MSRTSAKMGAEAKQKWLEELNEQQLEAVTHGDGPLLVVAGAGTGKTRTLAYRVAYLISKGVSPERILLLTFTRRASQEMINRAASAISLEGAAAGRVWGGTFHAIANRLLRIYASSARISPDFTIMDRSDAEDFLNVVRNDMALSQSDRRFPRKSTCMDIYSRRVNGDEDLDGVLKGSFPWCEIWKDELKALFKEYVDRKLKQNVLDYDDLLLYWYQLLQDDPIARHMGGRFDHILVDEYQDTNRIQAGILQRMRLEENNITVVGDDAQSIYSFRCATVRNILDFPTQFPGARVVTLEQNYRSVLPILVTTNRLIAQARERYSKELWSAGGDGQRPQMVTCFDESRQDDEVIRRVLDHYEQGIPLRRQAVLFRAASNSASLELALARRNIPFRKYGGLKFLEAAHVKDLVSILRVVENPRDQTAWFRILLLLSGVGPVTAAAAFEHIRASGFVASSISDFRAPAAARIEMAELGQMVGDLSRRELSLPAQMERISRFCEPLLRRNYEDAEARLSDIEHLAQLASRHQSRKEFLAELVLDPPISTGDLAGVPSLDEDWLVLSTIHSAKGLEWDVVYLIHAADGCLPSDMATGNNHEIEEELRVAYVAMTRARDFLYVLWPLRYYHKSAGRLTDNHSYAQRCRFLTDEVLESMDKIQYDSSMSDGEAGHAPVTSQGVLDRIRTMWD